MRALLSSMVSGLMLAVGLAAHADTFTFTANGSGGGFSGSGMLTTTYEGGGEYEIENITGPGVDGLLAPGSFQDNDNLLYPEGNPNLFPGEDSLLTQYGFAFFDVMGNTAYKVDIYGTNSGYAATLLDSDGHFQTGVPVSFSVASTPEPSSVALLGTGVLGVAGLLRRRVL